MSEVRRTADNLKGESGAKPSWERKQTKTQERGAWGGWRQNGQKRKCVNQGDLSWCLNEQDRSQSPRSSDEAANPRGAKGGRKVET
jgi:hypothetical protein